MINMIFSIICILVPSICFGILGKPTEMGLSILAGSLTIAFTNIDKFQKVKGGGFEAELKKVDVVVKEAYATIDNLREISKPLTKSVTLLLTYYNRWSGIHPKEENELIKNINDIVETMSIKDEEIDAHFERYYRYKKWDHFQAIVSSLNNTNYPDGIERCIFDDINKIYKIETVDYPNENTILSIINMDRDCLHEKTKIALDDYLNYLNPEKIIK